MLGFASAVAQVSSPVWTYSDLQTTSQPFLVNEALWDGFFFSGAAPDLRTGATVNPADAWDAPVATVHSDLDQVVGNFVRDPVNNPLGNPRMRLIRGGLDDEILIEKLLEPAGCTQIAAHLSVDGAFNVNSANVDAWAVQLSGLRDGDFLVEGGSPPGPELTAFPRFRHPTGKTDDNWNGFRALNDEQICTLVEHIVEEVRARGPFLSLAEFVNRRVEDSSLGRDGTIQAAIEKGDLNAQATQAAILIDRYPKVGQGNITADTGVGIPGFLTQADVLFQADVLLSLSPVIICRSDTFIIRGCGEAHDVAGNIQARAWVGAVVQRTPGFVDGGNPADAAIDALNPVNRTFGRRFEVMSFRRILGAEIR